MKSKVTLKELVGTKIIYAVLLVCYYWTWARRDWQEYYTAIQNGIAVFTIVFFAMQANRIHKYHKEEKDEMAVQNLRRIDAIGLKLMTAAAIVIAFACAVSCIDGATAGYALVGMILVLAVLRFIIFCVMDSGSLIWPLKRRSENIGKKRD
ncbi:MAG: hypothetical protein HFF99_05610 [Oscillibacter sp.]|nr:hypothetical protein [uncultured Oscillibacter sp.]MCI8970926.1 hypothetical protein [Oscillibacter sp.]